MEEVLVEVKVGWLEMKMDSYLLGDKFYDEREI